jgi:hypothetical protein
MFFPLVIYKKKHTRSRLQVNINYVFTYTLTKIQTPKFSIFITLLACARDSVYVELAYVAPDFHPPFHPPLSLANNKKNVSSSLVCAL